MYNDKLQRRQQRMMQVNNSLFNAFHEDHAALGRALYDLRNALAADDFRAAKKIAEKLEREAGAHIAFEEIDFYPALQPFLSDAEINDMYAEHAKGLALIEDIRNAEPAPVSAAMRQNFINRTEALEAHVSECGELFGAMGGLSTKEQEALKQRLDHWRKKAPSWSEAAVLARKTPR